MSGVVGFSEIYLKYIATYGHSDQIAIFAAKRLKNMKPQK